MDIIQYLLSIIKTPYQQNCWLLAFICRYIPLKQWSFDDSHSPKYEKFKTDPPLRPSENLDFLWPDNQFGHKICPFFMHIES